MSLFLDVVGDITLPIVLMIGLGYVLRARVGVEVTTLNRLVLYGTLPALLVTTLAEADLPAFELEATVLFALGQFGVLLVLGWLAAAALRLDPAVRPIIAMATAFLNTGNFGIPLIQLSLGPAFVPHQAIITVLLTILILALAPMLLAPRRASLRAALRDSLRTPLVPALLVGLLMNLFGIGLPQVIRFPLEMVGAAYTPTALIALGAHLGAGGWLVSRAAVGLGVGLRLVLGPLVTLAALVLLDLPGGLFDLFLIGAAAPVGVLLPIFCAEYGGQVKLASAMVALSTILSPVFVTLFVYLSKVT